MSREKDSRTILQVYVSGISAREYLLGKIMAYYVLVAIAWTLRQPAITAAIVGARRPDQVDGVLPAATFRLSESEILRIESWLAEHP